MYIPKLNLITDKDEIVKFMQQFSFATIITAKDNLPIATHLPFLVTTRDDKVLLTSHFAKANAQWADIVNNKVLVIFSQPHAYISPSNYNNEINVPTWNYISVHAYGHGTLITDQNQTVEVLENTINNYEIAYRQQWNNLSKDYKLSMLKGIVAFEIVVTDLQGKKKLSQNKTETEKQKIINTLSKSRDSNEQLIAEYMKGNQKHKK